MNTWEFAMLIPIHFLFEIFHKKKKKSGTIHKVVLHDAHTTAEKLKIAYIFTTWGGVN